MAAMAVVGLSTLACLAALFLDLALSLDLVPPSIAIYPPLPAPYSFDFGIYLDSIHGPVPCLYRRQILDSP